MSPYHGWEREELTREASLENQITLAEVPTVSFTHINQRIAPELKNLGGRGIDSDALYNLPRESVPQPAAQIPKKQGPKTVSKPTKPRSITLGQIWEYDDEGDSPQQGDPPAHKRRKLAPPKSAKSIKTILKSLAQTRKYDEELESVQQDREMDCETRGSQLTTPLDTVKKTNRGVGSEVSKGKGKQTELFQTSTITKLGSKQKAELQDVSQSQTIINHKGWITTEDAVKNSPILLAKTSLEKLVAFKYNATSTKHPPIIPDAELPNLSPGHASTHHQGALSRRISSYASLSYDFPPRNNSFFNQALRNASESAETSRTAIDLSRGHQASHAAANVHGPIVNPEGEIIHELDEASTLYGLPGSAGSDDMYMQNNVQSLHSDPHIQPSVMVTPQPLHPSEQALEEYALEEYAPEENPDVLPSNYSCVNYFPIGDVESLRQSEANDFYSNSNFQVTRSDQPHVQGTESSSQEEIPKDLWASDDFNEQGIEDEDFLALVSDTVIPETSPSGYPTPSSPEIILDDEFRDSDMEEVMLNMSELENGVKESFQPPASVTHQCAFDNSVTPGIYDSNLKFSPLKSHGSDKIMAPAEKDDCGREQERQCPYCFTCIIAGQTMSDACGLKSLAKARDRSFICSKDRNQDLEDSFTDVRSIRSSVSLPATPLTPPNVQRELSSPESVIIMTDDMHRSNPNPPTVLDDSTADRINDLDDSHEYLPLQAFARPDFPLLIRERSPVIGLSTQTVVRTCFRIGEMLKEGGRCNAVCQDAVIELFARVISSSLETGTARQSFQFADLFHDRPPFPNGILENFKTSGLAESESNAFLGAGAEEEQIARILGRLKKDAKNACWLLSIVSIRKSDWEEIRWTKRIVSGHEVMSKKDVRGCDEGILL